jgi:hypothetical protein
MKAFTVHDVFSIARFTDAPCITNFGVCSVTGEDAVPGYVQKLLGEDGLSIMTQLINSMYMKVKSGPRILMKLQ